VRAAVVLGHPHTEYGGTMHTKVVYQTAKALSRIGCAVLRINFRGAGASAGSFTGGPGEKDDFRTALDFMHNRYPEARMWAAGMSFGAWVALSIGAEDPRISTLIGIALPIATYDWDFGDGATGSGVTTAHAYAQADRYHVNLTVTDEAGVDAARASSGRLDAYRPGRERSIAASVFRRPGRSDHRGDGQASRRHACHPRR